MHKRFSVCRRNSRIALVSARFTADSVNRSDGALSISHTFNSSSKRKAAGQTFCAAGVCTYEGDALKTDSHAKEERIGVLLLNLGGPETLHDVQPFLFNLFADPVWLRIFLFFGSIVVLLVLLMLFHKGTVFQFLALFRISYVFQGRFAYCRGLLLRWYLFSGLQKVGRDMLP